MNKIDYTEVQNKIVKQATEHLTKKEIESKIQKQIEQAKVEKCKLLHDLVSEI